MLGLVLAIEKQYSQHICQCEGTYMRTKIGCFLYSFKVRILDLLTHKPRCFDENYDFRFALPMQNMHCLVLYTHMLFSVCFIIIRIINYCRTLNIQFFVCANITLLSIYIGNPYFIDIIIE